MNILSRVLTDVIVMCVERYQAITSGLGADQEAVAAPQRSSVELLATLQSRSAQMSAGDKERDKRRLKRGAEICESQTPATLQDSSVMEVIS